MGKQTTQARNCYEQCTVQVKLELGHCAQLRKKVTTEGFTHNWMVFVRGPEQCDIQHFVEKVVFRLPDSFPKPKRVCKVPPYKVEECGNAGFTMPIEIYFRRKEEPKEICFTYDLFFNLEGNPPVNHLRCEKLSFNNPSKEFRRNLLKAGGDIMQESIEAPKPHQVTEEQRESPRKDSESNISSKDVEHEQSKPSKDSSQKLIENKPPKEEKAAPAVELEDPKLALKETKPESLSLKDRPPPQQESKSSSKRPPTVESSVPSAKQLKKNRSKGLESCSSTCHRTASSSYPDKKPPKEKMGESVWSSPSNFSSSSDSDLQPSSHSHRQVADAV